MHMVKDEFAAKSGVVLRIKHTADVSLLWCSKRYCIFKLKMHNQLNFSMLI